MFDAVVIGAGPAGSVTARLLAQAGWSVALVEKCAFPRRKVCGEFLSAASLPLLESCGIGAAFSNSAGPSVTMVAAYAGDVMAQAPLPAPGRALGREHLDMLLRDAAVAAGAQLFQPCDMIEAVRHGDIHHCRIAHDDSETEIETRILVAAGGSWSPKGPFALPATTPAPSDLLAFKAHFHGGHLPQGVIPLLAFPGGYGGMVHSDSGRTSLSCCIRRDELARSRAAYGMRAGEAVLAHIAATTRGAALALDGAVLDGTVMAAGPIRPGIRPAYRDGVFFCGNRAGEAHPVIAEGISMAIQSGHLLARHLLKGGGTDAVGAAYARAWRRTFAPRIHAASLFAHAAMHGPARRMTAAIVARLPALLSMGARLAGKSP